MGRCSSGAAQGFVRGACRAGGRSADEQVARKPRMRNSGENGFAIGGDLRA
ncbi:hypothetical protein [Sphingobium baderi]|uniref:hypothetical protein n=1 Tax=Sphingobium baderi TaxID=1332080 RepID=UPI002B4065F8|nr:hypothetical protein [Sphingobium baderi]WRD78724.1 hypothetical protein QQ987_20275 [Sphingobium baderi]